MAGRNSRTTPSTHREDSREHRQDDSPTTPSRARKNPGNFANDRERARQAGKKGGRAPK